MIIDRIENIGYYESVLPGLSNGLKTLKQLASLESGRNFRGTSQLCGCSDYAAWMRGTCLGGIS